jgi:predicted transcriptional regulator
MRKKPVERLIRLSEERSRSVNYLAVNAILRYLDKEEKKE